MEKPEQIWFLLSRNLSGEATPAEKEALEKALHQQPSLMQQYELLQRLWKPDTAVNTEEVATRVNHILQRSAREAAQQEQQEQEVIPASALKKARVLKIVRWAAAVACISMGVWAWSFFSQKERGESNEIIAKKGSKTRTILPDGSTVWLNAGSSIVYDPGFRGDTREVTLQGEAYFDIVKMPQKPFIVHAGDINIRVLGTAFNVKSYAEEPTIETTLIRGSVQITRTGAKKGAPIYLHPHQKIVLLKVVASQAEETAAMKKEQEAIPDKATGIISIDSNLRENERLETAWIYNRLEFRGDRFDQLAKKLERWYNITIHFEDQQAPDLVFNGSLENETVEQAFKALTAAVSFQYEIKGNDIYIRSPNKTE